MRTNDGRELKHFVPVPKAYHLWLRTLEELVEKFVANAATELLKERAKIIAAMIGDLKSIEDISDLVCMCPSQFNDGSIMDSK